MIILEISLEKLSSIVKTAFKESFDETQTKKSELDTWFNLEQLCDYLPNNPAKPTVYGWVSRRLIPFHKKSKSLTFLKSEIDQWLKDGLHITSAQIAKEIANETDSFLSKKRKEVRNV